MSVIKLMTNFTLLILVSCFNQKPKKSREYNFEVKEEQFIYEHGGSHYDLTDTDFYTGSSSQRIHIKKGLKDNRYLQEKWYEPENTEVWYKVYFKLVETQYSKFDILRLATSKSRNQLSLKIENDKIYAFLFDRQIEHNSIQLERDKWHEIIIHTYYTKNNNGFMKVFINNNLLLDYSGYTIRPKESRTYGIRIGVWPNIIKKDSYIQFDNLKISYSSTEMNNLNIKKSSKTIKIKNTIDVKGTFDGENNIYEWIGEGDCSQEEEMPPMFRMYNDSKLKNVIIKNAPDGIHIMGSNVIIDKVLNLDVCEDAISVKGRQENITIRNSTFWYCADKAIQVSTHEFFAKNVLITNNQFLHCSQPVRIKSTGSFVTIKNNFYFYVGSGVNATKSKNIIFKDNLLYNPKELFGSDDAMIEVENNTVLRTKK